MAIVIVFKNEEAVLFGNNATHLVLKEDLSVFLGSNATHLVL